MLRASFTLLLAAASGLAASAAAPAPARATAPAASSPPQQDYAARAFALADRLVTCAYAPPLGVFATEALWQSGNTLETLSSTIALLDVVGEAAAPGRTAAWLAVLNNSFAKTPVIVDQCFDDHQWWLLAWARAYEVSGELDYLQRAVLVFDFIVANGWTPAFCGGGVSWCPVTGSDKPYKNAVTSELFFASAMALAPYEALTSKPDGFFVAWAERIWAWLDASGMQSAAGLFNDGLTQDACVNNGQTTWTYNQGLALSGLGRLAVSQGGNATLAAAALRLFGAAASLLTTGGILSEPCGSSCDGDQHIFKGVWVRHAVYLSNVQESVRALASPFLDANARSLLANATCTTGGYGDSWQGPACASQSGASDSAALDLLVAAAQLAPPSSTAWAALGVGACVDAQARAMPSCSAIVTGGEAACLAEAQADVASVAYSFEVGCLGVATCTVSTAASACSPGWARSDGSGATTVTAVDGKALALCVIRS